MINRILTVGGLTLVSRVTGFFRDMALAAVLGAGPIADAFFVALRLPNHFRAIFAEGAFNTAFVPAYARIREQSGAKAAHVFADQVFTLLLASQIVLLITALLFTPEVIRLLAPGFDTDATRFPLAVELTRITFPYLLMMTLVTLFSGILNALDRFAAAAAAPILLNLSMIGALFFAGYFATPGHAAAWGVLAAGAMEALLVAANIAALGAMTRLRLPRWDTDVKRFFAALGPAVTGSAGLQLALFADTIIASFLPYGALSALYYADRLYQLPIGVIGIAAGTVVLPEMARRLAAGDERGAQEAQNRTIEFILALAIPCMVAFLFIPDLIMRALFARGAFTSADAAAAGATLAAYTTGLIPFVLIRSATATFFARGDTATPVKAALAAAALNIFLKFLLMTPLAQVGLALATAIGAWVNFILVMWLALRAGLIRVDARLKDAIWKLAVAGLVLALVLWFGAPYADKLLNVAALRDEIALVILAAVGGVVYGGALLALFGWHRVKTFSPKRDASSVLAAED